MLVVVPGPDRHVLSFRLQRHFQYFLGLLQILRVGESKTAWYLCHELGFPLFVHDICYGLHLEDDVMTVIQGEFLGSGTLVWLVSGTRDW